MRGSSLSLLALALAGSASAANTYSDDDFNNRRGFVAQDLAPIWFFADGSCYPQAAETNGQQTNGNGAATICTSKQDKGCQSPGNWNGPGTRGSDFPTYYTISDCGDHTKRVCYDIYFRHDTGHESDWEYACVVLSRESDGRWFRNGIILEQDGVSDNTGAAVKTAYFNWGDLETWTNGRSFTDTSGRNLNHAMIYSAKFHHTMFPNQYTALGKNNCATAVIEMFRNNDFYYPAADWLVDGSAIPAGWNWGKAHSAPQVLASEVCGYSTKANVPIAGHF